MYENYTFEALTEKMLENVSDKFDKREGSVIYDAIAPAALELANFYIALDMAINEIFADSASYYYLVKRAAERGLYPKEETNAILQMKVTPKNTPIAVNDRFNLSDSLNYMVTSIIDADEGIYQVECETAGIEGNQHLGEVIAIETENDLNNMEKAILTEVLVPGEEEEDVETFRERYFASFDSKAFGGNRADYKEKINNINGIGGCKVTRAWENSYNPSDMIPTVPVKEWIKNQSEQTLESGVYQWIKKVYDAAEQKLLTVGGTVKVVVITSEYKVPSGTLVDLVQNTLDPEINAGEGDGIAPIGHIVNVFGVKPVSINVSANITYEQGYSFLNAQEHICELLDDYFLELSELWAGEDNLIVRISEIESRMLKLDEIGDITDISLNGLNKNILLDEDSIPVRGDVIG